MQNIELTKYERALLEKVQAQYPGKNVTFSYIVVDELIENGNIAFPILEADIGKTTKNKSERRLKLNEVFIPTRVKLQLKKVVSSGHAQAVGYCYPNASVFGPDASGYTFSHLEAVYNGFLSMQMQELVYEPSIECARFRYVPERQKGEYNTDTASTPIVVTTTIIDPSNPYDGEVLLQSSPSLKGNVQHTVTLTIPDASNLEMKNTNSNSQNFARLTLRGILVQNAA